MQFGIGIRVLAFGSFILGVVLLCVCGWTYSKFVTGEIGQNSTMIALKKAQQRENNSKTPQPLTSEISTVFDAYAHLQKEWKEFKPFLMGSGGVAIFSGIIQVLTAMALLCSGTKGARDRVGCFKMTHFIIAVALLAALIVPATFDVSHDSWSQKLKVIFHQIKEELHKVADENFSPDAVTAYYGVIAADVVGIIIIIVSTCCLMRDAQYDYRQYP